MARKRKGPKTSALEAAARRASSPPTPRRTKRSIARYEDPPTSYDAFSLAVEKRQARPGRKRGPVFPPEPRPRRLSTEKRLALVRVLAKGKAPLGERRRREARAGLSQALHEAICAERAKRREVMFATGNGGSRKKQRPRKRSVWDDVKC